MTAAPNASNPSSSASLSWTDIATNAAGYTVQRSSDGVSFNQVAQSALNVWNQYLAHLKSPADADPKPVNRFWTVPQATGRYAWTDQTRKPLAGLFRSDPAVSGVRDRVRMAVVIGRLSQEPGAQGKNEPFRVPGSCWKTHRQDARFVGKLDGRG